MFDDFSSALNFYFWLFCIGHEIISFGLTRSIAALSRHKLPALRTQPGVHERMRGRPAMLILIIIIIITIFMVWKRCWLIDRFYGLHGLHRLLRLHGFHGLHGLHCLHRLGALGGLHRKKATLRHGERGKGKRVNGGRKKVGG
jgi:hypothetical protein